MDCDGQHKISDLKNMLRHRHTHDFILGVRNLFHKKMPIQRKILNLSGNFITWFFFGKFVRDSQSGFRVLNKKAINCMEITFNRFEFCSEMFYSIKKNKLKIKQVPIIVHYDKYTLQKLHGQNILNGFKMIYRFSIWKKNKILDVVGRKIFKEKKK